ncbi:hypothetical protein, partial [Lactobacillus jensenii]|uniref:hypothetical protein n=1 Tax=Lactobacillus jensenii TaxID=109790 RepID=UPI0028704C4A
LNWDNTEQARKKAALLLRNHAEGTVKEVNIYAQNEEKPKCEITAKFAYFNKILVTELSNEELLAIFDRINFETKVSGD